MNARKKRHGVPEGQNHRLSPSRARDNLQETRLHRKDRPLKRRGSDERATPTCHRINCLARNYGLIRPRIGEVYNIAAKVRRHACIATVIVEGFSDATCDLSHMLSGFIEAVCPGGDIFRARCLTGNLAERTLPLHCLCRLVWRGIKPDANCIREWRQPWL